MLMSMKQRFYSIFRKSNVNAREIERQAKGREYQFEYVNFAILEGDNVLDIGSGQHPFSLATHLADLKPDDNFDRGGAALRRDDRPFYLIDIEAMPFKDKEFDFVYCSHVLEHVDDPIAACRELIRVGKRGYIETPTRASDMLYNYPHLHRWHVAKAENTLIFVEYSKRERLGTGSNYFEQQQRNPFQNSVKQMVFNNRDLFCNMFLWEKKFDVHIFDRNGIHKELRFDPD